MNGFDISAPTSDNFPKTVKMDMWKYGFHPRDSCLVHWFNGLKSVNLAVII